MAGWRESVSRRALWTANSILSSMTATYCPWLGGGSQSAGGHCGRQTVSLAPSQQHTVHGWVEGDSQQEGTADSKQYPKLHDSNILSMARWRESVSGRALRTANSILSSMTATYCPRLGGGRQSAGGHRGRKQYP